MDNGLHDSDVLAWSEWQAEMLRRLQAGERAGIEIDWPNLIEEVTHVGSSELAACRSLLQQAIAHLIKLARGPRGPGAHWASEIVGFLGQARERFSSSMRQRLDLDRIYRLGRHQAETALRRHIEDLPAACPWSLDELLSEDPDIQVLTARLDPS